MPYFRTLGKLPHKRRTLFPKGDGSFYHEELVGEEGFNSDLSHVYHENAPTQIIKAETIERDPVRTVENWPLLHRHFETAKLQAGDLVLGRSLLLTNEDVTIGFASSRETSDLYRNVNGDECIYIQEGSGQLLSMFGPLEVQAGDYVVIPAGVIHQWVPGDEAMTVLTIESTGHIKPPSRYLSDAGQFLEMAPYRERDLRGPQELLDVHEGEAEVVIKRGERFTRLTFRHHPFDVVGWNGMVYPYAFSIHAFEPIVGRIHQPPPVHQTFEAPGFVVCSFVPRLSDYDPDAVGGPANHMNIDADEVMFYSAGNYAARSGSGIQQGSISLHPLGLTHGPQRGPNPDRVPGVMLDEIAVMVDAFRPLNITSTATEIEATDYHLSWDRNFEGAKNDG